MGIEIPTELQWVAKYVVGAGDWPKGDETAMRRIATGWDDLAKALTEIQTDANGVTTAALAAVDGQTHESIKQLWDQVGGEKGLLPGLIEEAKNLSKELGDTATDIEHTKYVIIASLVIFAIQMIQAIALACTGIGAPAAAAEEAAATVATRFTVQQAIKWLIEKISARVLAKAALMGAIQGVGVDAGASILQMAQGKRGGFTGDELKGLAGEAVSGAVSGVVGEKLGSGGLSKGLVDRAESTAGKFATRTAVDSVSGAVSSVAGTAAAVPFGQKFEIDPTELATSSIAGGVQSAADGARADRSHGGDHNSDSGSSHSDPSDHSPSNPGPTAPNGSHTGDNSPPAQPNSAPHDTNSSPAPTAPHNADSAPAPTGPHETGPAHPTPGDSTAPASHTGNEHAGNPTESPAPQHDSPPPSNGPAPGQHTPDSTSPPGHDQSPGTDSNPAQPPAHPGSSLNWDHDQPPHPEPANAVHDSPPDTSGNSPGPSQDGTPAPAHSDHQAPHQPDAGTPAPEPGTPGPAQHHDTSTAPPTDSPAGQHHPGDTQPGPSHNDPSPGPAHNGPADSQPAPGRSGPADAQPGPAHTGPSDAQPAPPHNSPADHPPSVPTHNGPTDTQPTPAHNGPSDAQPAPPQNSRADHPPSAPTHNGPTDTQPTPAHNGPADAQPAPAHTGPSDTQPAPSHNGPADHPTSTPTSAPHPVAGDSETSTTAASTTTASAPTAAPPMGSLGSAGSAAGGAGEGTHRPNAPTHIPTSADAPQPTVHPSPLGTDNPARPDNRPPRDTASRPDTPPARPTDRADAQPNRGGTPEPSTPPAASRPAPNTTSPRPAPETSSPRPTPNGESPRRPTGQDVGARREVPNAEPSNRPPHNGSEPHRPADSTPPTQPPDRPGFDPKKHKYVARDNNGRILQPDPAYAGQHNPRIGRYQPTMEEISTARAYPPGETPHDQEVRRWKDHQDAHPEAPRPLENSTSNEPTPAREPTPRREPDAANTPESPTAHPASHPTDHPTEGHPPHNTEHPSRTPENRSPRNEPASSNPPHWAHHDPNFMANSARPPEFMRRGAHPSPGNHPHPGPHPEPHRPSGRPDHPGSPRRNRSHQEEPQPNRTHPENHRPGRPDTTRPEHRTPPENSGRPRPESAPPRHPSGNPRETAPPARTAGTGPTGHNPAHSGNPPTRHPNTNHPTPHPGSHPNANHPGAIHHPPNAAPPIHPHPQPAGEVVDRNGVRRFTTDEAGQNYGDRHLARVLHSLPPELRHAVYQYTVQSFPNGFLRAPNPGQAVGRHFDRLRNDSFATAALTHANGGQMPSTASDLKRLARRSDLDPYQRQLVDYLRSQPKPEAHLREIASNQRSWEFLHHYFNGPPTVEAFAQRIAATDHALNQPLPESVQVLRGLGDLSFMEVSPGQQLGAGGDPRALIGTTQVEHSYMSTSLGANLTEVDGKGFPVRVEMSVPAGTPGLWMGHDSAYPDQRELILQRETHYRITDVVHTGWMQTQDGWRPTFTVHAEVIPPQHFSNVNPAAHENQPAAPAPRTDLGPSARRPDEHPANATPNEPVPRPDTGAQPAPTSHRPERSDPAPARPVGRPVGDRPSDAHQDNVQAHRNQPDRLNEPPAPNHREPADAAPAHRPAPTDRVHPGGPVANDASRPTRPAEPVTGKGHPADPPATTPTAEARPPHRADTASTGETHLEARTPDDRRADGPRPSVEPARPAPETPRSATASAAPVESPRPTRDAPDIGRREHLSEPARPDRDDAAPVRHRQDEPPQVHAEPTADQRRALHTYTDPDANAYTDLNKRLRDNAELDPDQHRFAQDISDGLRNLPAHNGTVWRGAMLSPEDLARYVPGETVTEPAFTSSSRDPNRKFSGNVEFVIHSSTGRDISGASARPGEHEVLFDRNTTFEVRGVVHDPGMGLTGGTRVYLYETPPHTPSPEHPAEHQHTGEAAAHHDSELPAHTTEPEHPVTHGPDRTAIGDDPQTRRVYDNLRNEGEHDVILHGNRFGRPTPGHEGESSPHAVAEAIRSNPDYQPGTPVRLVSCHSGNEIGWAQQLANELGAPVRAPSDTVGVRQVPDSPAMVHDGGHWVDFHPAADGAPAPEATHHAPASDSDGPHRTIDGKRTGWDIMGGDKPDGSSGDHRHANEDVGDQTPAEGDGRPEDSAADHHRPGEDESYPTLSDKTHKRVLAADTFLDDSGISPQSVYGDLPTNHPARVRLAGVIENTRFPSRSGDLAAQAARFAVSSQPSGDPISFVNRYEYTHAKFREFQLDVDYSEKPVGESNKSYAARLFKMSDVESALSKDIKEVRELGFHAADIEPTATKEGLVDAVRKIEKLGFENSDGAAYHVIKHINELPEIERSGLSEVEAYHSSAVRTVEFGTLVAIESEHDGTLKLVYHRDVATGTEDVKMEAIVKVSTTGTVRMASYGSPKAVQ
ncbi:ADP-ribosyltransferase [Nocardia nova]|uniref:ADP-ribosyltransferase n=1 Tax=Nocardia nova TaxID=37330 RepID=UPI0033E0D358